MRWAEELSTSLQYDLQWWERIWRHVTRQQGRDIVVKRLAVSELRRDAVVGEVDVEGVKVTDVLTHECL